VLRLHPNPLVIAGLKLPSTAKICLSIVGGFHFQTYARQIGNLPQVGMNIKNL